METKIRILIVDDNRRFREALRAFLDSRPSLLVVGEASNGYEAVEQARTLEPDLTIVNLDTPDLNGVEATREIRKTRPGSTVLVLTEPDSESLLSQAIEAGAIGFLSKSEIRRLMVALKEP